jgi:DNA-directed RNA polymerase subunit H (RpoH/RPB5)
LFRVNNEPIRTERDGDFNCIALMDAASCFLLGSELIPVTAVEPTRAQFERLLSNARCHKQQLPKTLYIPLEDVAEVIAQEAGEKHIQVMRVSETELAIFLGEARQAFAERFEEPPR